MKTIIEMRAEINAKLCDLTRDIKFFEGLLVYLEKREEELKE